MPNYRPIFPSIFTAGNMFCGFLAIISAAEGEPTHAAWFILTAGFLDGLDGRVARLSGSMSSFGKELDSLADIISFGVAPAFLIYTFKLNSLGKWGWIIGMVYITASAFRLARFNLLASSEEKKNFLGLPVPGAGLTLAAFVIFCYNIWGQIEYGEYLITMTILFSALMVSQVEYDALPENFNTRQNRIKLLYIITVAIAGIIRPRLLLFPILLSYVVYGLVKEAMRIVRMATATVSRNGRTDQGARNRKDDDEDE